MRVPFSLHPHQRLLLVDFFFFLRSYLFLERGEGREKGREGEEHWLVASRTPQTAHLARNPGLCPDQESNWQPLGLQPSPQGHTSQGCRLLGSSRSDRCEVLPHCGFDSHFSDVEHLFTSLLATCMPSVSYLDLLCVTDVVFFRS